MINIALRSEYSFQQAFAPLKKLVESQTEVVCLADDSTFGFYKLQKLCKNKKAIFGIRVMAVKDPKEKIKPRGQYGPEFILIAKNTDGLKEIYSVITESTKNFFYRSHVGLIDIWNLSENVIVISDSTTIIERLDYIGLSTITPKKISQINSIPKIAIQNNRYINVEDKPVYELFTGQRKMSKQTYPQHILSRDEWFSQWKNDSAIENTYIISDQCNATIDKAPRMKYRGKDNIENLCLSAAKRKGINLNDSVYKERYEREMQIIKEKDFIDYFMIVSEIIRNAKKTMLVGPSRGSSAGSLVCYLLDITEIDPIKYDLLFERFIDINRTDEPDIDVDFPDTKRDGVIKDLIKINGADRVSPIGTISRMKPKISISEFSKELCIPREEVEPLLKSIIKHSSGDVRYGDSIEETINHTEYGKYFFEKYPAIKFTTQIENHIRHKSIHASGILISKNKILDHCAVDLKNKSTMIEWKDAESYDLMKIDILGLSTLTCLEEVANLVGFDFRQFYDLPLDDDTVFEIFRRKLLRGVFQFEGFALKNLCRSILVTKFDELTAITSLARPGPLHCGASTTFCEIHQGIIPLQYVLNHPIIKEITEETLGQVIYQEQLMKIVREIGRMSWEDVGKIRRIISKSQGEEYFNQYKIKFLEGALYNGISEKDASDLWKKMILFGAYAFNKSHAVAYALISYWTAWCKVYYPLEFSVAYLNNIGNTDTQLKFLREMKKYFGVDYVPVDPDESEIKWSIKNGKLLGGLTNIDGIGIANAKKIIDCRNKKIIPPPSLAKKLIHHKTDFDILNECYFLFKNYYDDPINNLSYIKNVNKKGTYTIIGKLIKKDLRDLNEYTNIQKRGGEIYTDNTHLLNLIFEDDTDTIMGRIGRYDYDRIGIDIAQNGIEKENYYFVTGNIINDNVIYLFIKAIGKLK